MLAKQLRQTREPGEAAVVAIAVKPDGSERSDHAGPVPMDGCEAQARAGCCRSGLLEGDHLCLGAAPELHHLPAYTVRAAECEPGVRLPLALEGQEVARSLPDRLHVLCFKREACRGVVARIGD